MPVYEYECPNCGKSVEREYKISEYPGTIVCDDCQSEAKLRISRTSFSLKGVGWACVGGYLIYRGLTGYCPAFKAAHISTASQIKPPQIKTGNQARYQSQQQKPVDPAMENDGLIDEVALQSFPASDPPAWTTRRA